MKISSLVIGVITMTLLSSASAMKPAAESKPALCESDCKMEKQFFRRYAREGASIANHALAIMAYQGLGSEQDIEAGNRYLLKAARAGEPIAQYQLAYQYMNGLFIERDFEQAEFWFNKAARNQILDSQQRLQILTLHNRSLSVMNNEKSQVSSPESAQFIQGGVAKGIQSVKTSFSSASQQPDLLSIPVDEVVSVTTGMSLAGLLHAAKMQTCTHESCDMDLVETLIPRVVVKRDDKTLQFLTSGSQ